MTPYRAFSSNQKHQYGEEMIETSPNRTQQELNKFRAVLPIS